MQLAQQVFGGGRVLRDPAGAVEGQDAGDVGPGSFGGCALAQRGGPQTGAQVGGEDVGRLLTLVVSAGLDEFFEEVGAPGTDISTPPSFGPQEIESLLESAGRYGIEIPPPPEERGE